MLKVLKIAARNLLRYGRRTALTSALIVIGMVAVLLFVAVTGSFKSLMIGQITDSMLGHLQVHSAGYVASIDSLPLNLNMSAAAVGQVERALAALDGVEAWSPRIKFGGMFSNFTETTSIRVNGIDPLREAAVTPLLPGRVLEGRGGGAVLKPGEIWVPVLLASGLKIKAGDTVVLVATNKEGSINGKTFTVKGTLESVSGPGGRDGYIHIDDARELLRMTGLEVSEIALRLQAGAAADKLLRRLEAALAGVIDTQGRPALEVHPWQQLTPFASIAGMIDILTLFIKIMLVSIVLVSVMNVMVMAVYERIREIGTIAAIGTRPGRVLALFLSEGLLLGIAGTLAGTVVSLAAIYLLNLAEFTFSFGQQANILLSARVGTADVVTIALLVIVVALLATLQPAWKASRMDPITALRHV